MLATIWMTRNCNLKCSYCYEGNEKNSSSITYNVIDKSIDFLLDYLKAQECNKVCISIHGGEPLLEFEKIKYLVNKSKEIFRKNGISISFTMTTNATLINTSEIKQFLIDDINQLSISIDGDEESNDRNRRTKLEKGTYSDIIKNIKELIINKKNIDARLTITPSEANKIDKNIMHLYDLGFRSIVPVIEHTISEWDTDDFELIFDKLVSLNDFINEKKLEDSELYIGLIDDMNPLKTKGDCSGGVKTINIDCNGDIYPCTITNGIYDSKIGDIYSGISANKISEIEHISIKKDSICNNCTLFRYCIGPRCKIINKIQTGDYNVVKSVTCATERLKFRLFKYYHLSNQ